MPQRKARRTEFVDRLIKLLGITLPVVQRGTHYYAIGEGGWRVRLDGDPKGAMSFEVEGVVFRGRHYPQSGTAYFQRRKAKNVRRAQHSR